MQNFKKQLYSNETTEIYQLMKFAKYSDNFIFYVCNHFQLLFENAYTYNSTASKQLEYYVSVGSITYNADLSQKNLLEHCSDVKTFLDNNSSYKKDCFLFFTDVEKFEVLIIEQLFRDYALKYDYTETELNNNNDNNK